MKNSIGKLGAVLCLSVGFTAGASAVAPDFIDKLQSDARPAAEKVRDSERRPVQVMNELGVEAGWTVVDVSAGGGWYTEVISAAVGPDGTVLSQIGPRALENDGAGARAAQSRADRLGNVEVVTTEMSEIPAGTADAALTALNLHDQFNFRGDEAATAFLRNIYNVLKSGGVAAIIDHNGDAGADNSNLHRMPSAEAVRLLEEVGFEIVKESNVLRTYADDRTLSVGDPPLARNTDRFLIIVRKP